MAHQESTFVCTITTPQGVLFSSPIRRATLPTEEGEITILSNHEPMIALARKGRAEIEHEGREEIYEIESGVVEMQHSGELLLLLKDATRTDR